MTTTPEAPSRPVDIDMPDKVVLRSVEEKDLPALGDLDKAVFNEVAYPLYVLKSLYLVFRKTWYIIECDGVLAGYALVAPDSDNSEAWLMGLAIGSDYQGRGLGRRLMAQAMVLMKKTGASDAYITVRPGNDAATHLYQAFGFAQKGEDEPNFWYTGESRKVLHRSLVDNPYEPE